MSSFMGLEIGKRSIMTNQAALNITGHNVSNAETPGYSRQIANLTANRPWHSPSLVSAGGAGQLGTGVDLKSIDRMRDSFLDSQIRNENRTSGYWDSMQQSLARIEVVLNEPSEDGLRSVMDQFWKSWQDLAGNPESEAVRSVVAQRGMAVGDVFNHTYRQLEDLREDVNASVKIKVDEVNSIALQLKDLNQQIMAISISGKKPNDLCDKRDLLLDKLSKVADVKVFNEQNNMIAVQLGGRTLVQGVSCLKLTTLQDGQGMHMVVWDSDKVKAQINGGEIGGLLNARGKTLNPQDADANYKETIPTLINKLNTLAKTIAVKTNEVHRVGFSLNNKTGTADGTDFFTMSGGGPSNWAECLQVNTLIYNDPKNIAAAVARTWDGAGNKVNFGDGSNALAIAQIKHALVIGGGVTTDDYWRSLTADVGVQSQEAQRMVINQDVLCNQLENKRQSLSGVQLDEEMTNMIKYQHAYNAASRFITTIDEELDQVINRMGIVGR